MDYEKKYKEDLERARQFSEHPLQEDSSNIVEYIFPELQESKDERIRKEIIATIHLYYGEPLEDEAKEMIAWLENQGEQKHVNKVEPKFHEGDWVVLSTSDGEKVVQIDSIEYFKSGEPMYITSEGRWFGNGTKAHLWTIQDAKDGDVLYSIDSKQPFIYKERPQFSQAKGYCCINKFGEFAIWNTSKCVICTDKYIPATKEQRDLLFQKMKEAGYEWDSEKKGLKKISQRMVSAEAKEALYDKPINQ